ncbi:MAG: type II CRISPR RNA-guided endonuclease Cas9, partial [Clostridia bacterium]
MKKSGTNYNIGLDIGTNSVGWAVIDDENKVIKLNSKRNMWGVRLFDAAETAVTRRLFRSNSRRMKRKKERIKLLQELLKDDIQKVDQNFYDSLKLSKYHKEDGMVINKSKIYRDNKYNLFNELDYTDKDFYKKYKTIYHLRNKLINSDEKEDIRLIYLAIHHILKYRGNFLYNGKFEVNNIQNITPKLKNIIKYITDAEEEIYIDEDKIFDVLRNSKLCKKEKQEKILNTFVVDNETKKKLKVLFRLIISAKEDISVIFDLPEKKSLRLTEDYDEVEIEDLLGEDIEYFNCIKELNSWYTLQYILKNNTYISDAFVEKYNKYQMDLKLLKKIYIKYLPEKYNDMFKSSDDKLKNYVQYDNKNCSNEDLCITIKKEFNNLKSDDIEIILKDIENEEFLVRLNTTENGAIPYQLHEIELIKILEKQAKYYPSITKNKEKILKILSFKIPYYVGPLHNDSKQLNNWSVRNEGMEHTKVLPWNFEEVIDKDACANLFIRRMTNKCTYLPLEDVMPKYSLLYSKYCVLNELNNIKCDGKQLSIEEKKLVIEKLFKNRKTITEKVFKNFLVINNNKKTSDITGFQKNKEFSTSLSSYIDFKKILGIVDESNIEMIENIIEWITVFEDKEILERKIKAKYGDFLTEEQFKSIVKLPYKGWSRLSKKLLCELKYKNEDTNELSIMDLLEKTGYNFMQIINDKEFGFNKQIEEAQVEIENKKINPQFYDDNVATIPGSPALKRGIWQTIKIVDEIVKIMGHAPDNIYVEFAREDQESKRTVSRILKLQKAYAKFCEDNESEINKDIRKNLKNTKLDITDRLYLYYMQNGKCMYSEETLDIDHLELYQIDHIIPQSKIKNDSFDNKVLVKSIENQRKLDGFLNNNIINDRKVFWKRLFDANLISQTKYFSLLNNDDSDKRTEGFIKRQLVETRQITKYVTNIMQKLYLNTNVCALKSELAHDFRQKYDIFKIREINDIHHVHDAYINAVIGSYINKRYPKMLREFVYSDYIKDFNKETKNTEENKNKKYGFIVSNMGKEYVDKQTGEIIDAKTSEKYIQDILKQLKIKNVYVTKKLEENTGQFYKQNALSAKAAQKMSNPLPLKEELDPLKYGAYSGEICAYMVLFKYINNNKEYFQIQGIPVKDRNIVKDNIIKLEEYIENKFNY